MIAHTPFVVKCIVSLYRYGEHFKFFLFFFLFCYKCLQAFRVQNNSKHRGENVLRNLLNKTVSDVLKCDKLRLCLNPAELYRNWVNKLETATGKSSGMPYEVTNQKALEHAEIRKQLDDNIRLVKTHTSKFLVLILKSIGKIP